MNVNLIVASASRLLRNERENFIKTKEGIPITEEN